MVHVYSSTGIDSTGRWQVLERNDEGAYLRGAMGRYPWVWGIYTACSTERVDGELDGWILRSSVPPSIYNVATCLPITNILMHSGQHSRYSSSSLPPPTKCRMCSVVRNSQISSRPPIHPAKVLKLDSQAVSRKRAVYPHHCHGKIFSRTRKDRAETTKSKNKSRQ